MLTALSSHVIIWEAARVGGARAHGLDANVQTNTQPGSHVVSARLRELSEALRGFHNARVQHLSLVHLMAIDPL